MDFARRYRDCDLPLAVFSLDFKNRESGASALPVLWRLGRQRMIGVWGFSSHIVVDRPYSKTIDIFERQAASARGAAAWHDKPCFDLNANVEAVSRGLESQDEESWKCTGNNPPAVVFMGKHIETIEGSNMIVQLDHRSSTGANARTLGRHTDTWNSSCVRAGHSSLA